MRGVMSRLVVGRTILLLACVRLGFGGGFCPTTLPGSPAFKPPIPYREMIIDGFWYGSDALWVHLPLDGTWRNLPFNAGSYGQKIFWFSRDYDWHKEPHPNIVVTSKRVDAGGPTFTLESATNAIFSGNTQAMLTGAILPTTGCWEITGRYRGNALSFVVSVER